MVKKILQVLRGDFNLQNDDRSNYEYVLFFLIFLYVFKFLQFSENEYPHFLIRCMI